MTSQLTKTPDGTITLSITLPKAEVKKAWEAEVVRAVENAELPGFRKGKAPRSMVEEKLDKTHLQEDVLRKLLPDAYAKAVEEHKLRPVMSPKVHVEKLDEGEDWVFSAVSCETPVVDLDGYKDAVKKVTAKSKIVIPGKEQAEINMDELMDALLKAVKITVPQVLTEAEVERLLSQLLDEVKSLGLSLDQYLSSTHKTIDQLKKEYEERANKDIQFEFALQKIADEEKITVDPKEIEEAINKAKDDRERQNLQANIYLLATILRQQKTLDFLKNL
ncbi:MAG TPA: trigger factor [Candidatus Saccharimonadales bacterium]|nr:trigger factor [Candidatus Saccharimonadales bacterium]